jgi:hypothetical protein
MIICEICGKEFEKRHWGDEYSKICSDECFGKKFWKIIIEDKDNRVIVNHRCYHFDKNKPMKNYDTDYNGYGGRIFNIRFKNGETYITNDLWYQGDVPEQYLGDLPDNAEFL